MSTNTNHPVFQSSSAFSLGRSAFTKTQTDIVSGGALTGYIGRDWADEPPNGIGIRVYLTNRTVFVQNNQDESKELKLTTSFTTAGLPVTIGSYTTVDGEVVPASKQRVSITNARFKSNSGGFGWSTNFFAVQGGLSYHYWNGTTYNYSYVNSFQPYGYQNTTIDEQGLSYDYNPSTGDDDLATDFDFRVRLVQQENTSNDSWQGGGIITPEFTGTVTSYYIGRLLSFDGVDGDFIDPSTTDSTVTCEASVSVGVDTSYDLQSPNTISITAKNTVGFPFTGTQFYIADDYIEDGSSYASNAVNQYDYVLDGYYTVGYIEEATLQSANSGGANISDDPYFETYVFNPSVTMLQSFVSESTVPNVLLGQLFDSGSLTLASENICLPTGTRIKGFEAIIASETQTVFSGGRIQQIASSVDSETAVVASSGRLQQIASQLVSDTQQTAIPFYLLGGEGIVAGASAIYTQPGYLQSSGNLNIQADADVVLGTNTNANLGIILKGFDVDIAADTQTDFSGGLNFFVDETLQADSQTTTIPGYLFSNDVEATISSDTAFTGLGGLSFLEPQAFVESTFTVPNPLCGFRLLGETTLVSNNFQLSAGKKWLVDPYRRLLVKPETRLSTIPLETALFTVDMENRLNTITQETNDILVKQETRNYKIKQAPIVFLDNARTERV